MSITTRAVGFATAIAYQRTCTTWNTAAIAEIATIHVVYRVHLLLVHLKLYLAQQIQTEAVSVENALQHIFLADEIREELILITQVPNVMAMILDCIGKVEQDGFIWHVGYPTRDLCDEEYDSLVINPDTMRDLLHRLSNPATSAVMRRDFIKYNSIPGAKFEGELLVNADDIWPVRYSSGDILADIHSYKNWITRKLRAIDNHNPPWKINQASCDNSV
ncbi:PREDICTED: uncharacterized protein LOC108379631 [Rhagoletis zephyria]|uniref:uncharacterized protein LOC108379631 n=1 Tax=Rhagoletis zephyria TaxID=28612 RepID=UPI0008112C40|nr:PREDICTED: uncharacterized protein LOC108379631 [Rhagoletis zephyria]